MAPLDPLHFPPVSVDWPAPWHYAPMLLWIPACYIGYRIFRTLFALLKAVFIYLICPIFYKPDLSKYENRWTVVTGGTDGIGKAYMYELANRGLSKFVVIGRSPSKMNDVKTYLELNHNCRVKTFQFDFMYDDYAKLAAFLSDIDIGFVVNSVGVGREVMERYGDNCPADHQILRVNGLGSADFMAMVLQPMERHGGGQIVCLSSSQGYRPIPYLAAYCASKTMLSFLCEAIHREYSTINVQCLTPALIATKMTYYKNGGLFVATPEAFCREAVNTLGITWKTSGCFNHEFQMLLMHLFPWSVLKYLIMPIYYFHKRRVIKLHAQEAQEKMTLTRATA